MNEDGSFVALLVGDSGAAHPGQPLEPGDLVHDLPARARSWSASVASTRRSGSARAEGVGQARRSSTSCERSARVRASRTTPAGRHRIPNGPIRQTSGGSSLRATAPASATSCASTAIPARPSAGCSLARWAAQRSRWPRGNAGQAAHSSRNAARPAARLPLVTPGAVDTGKDRARSRPARSSTTAPHPLPVRRVAAALSPVARHDSLAAGPQAGDAPVAAGVRRCLRGRRPRCDRRTTTACMPSTA